MKNAIVIADSREAAAKEAGDILLSKVLDHLQHNIIMCTRLTFIVKWASWLLRDQLPWKQ